MFTPVTAQVQGELCHSTANPDVLTVLPGVVIGMVVKYSSPAKR